MWGLDHGQELIMSGGHSGFCLRSLSAGRIKEEIVEPGSIAQSRLVRIFVFRMVADRGLFLRDWDLIVHLSIIAVG